MKKLLLLIVFLPKFAFGDMKPLSQIHMSDTSESTVLYILYRCAALQYGWSGLMNNRKDQKSQDMKKSQDVFRDPECLSGRGMSFEIPDEFQDSECFSGRGMSFASRDVFRIHVAMSILYRVVDLGKAETPVFHIEKTYQKRRFFHQKIN